MDRHGSREDLPTVQRIGTNCWESMGDPSLETSQRHKSWQTAKKKQKEGGEAEEKSFSVISTSSCCALWETSEIADKQGLRYHQGSLQIWEMVPQGSNFKKRKKEKKKEKPPKNFFGGEKC